MENDKKIYKICRYIIRSVIWIYCKVVYRFSVNGVENIPKTGAVIFCGNHKGLLDAPLIEITCKRDDNRFLAKQELVSNFIMSFLGRVFHVILVKRNDKDLGPMKESLKTLKNNNAISLFPEGTRNGLKKGRKPKTGVAYFALNSDAVVIPVGIKGGEKPFKKIVITYGKPINIEIYINKKKEKETVQEVTNIFMEEILKLIK